MESRTRVPEQWVVVIEVTGVPEAVETLIDRTPPRSPRRPPRTPGEMTPSSVPVGT